MVVWLWEKWGNVFGGRLGKGGFWWEVEESGLSGLGLGLYDDFYRSMILEC